MGDSTISCLSADQTLRHRPMYAASLNLVGVNQIVVRGVRLAEHWKSVQACAFQGNLPLSMMAPRVSWPCRP